MPLNIPSPSGPPPRPNTIDDAAITANVMQFGRLLRRAGLDVDPGQTATFLRALTLVGLGVRRNVRVAGRTIFVRRVEDQPLYDAAFELFWRRPSGTSRLSGQLPRIRQSEDRGALSGGPMKPEAEAEELLAVVRAQAASARVLREALASGGEALRWRGLRRTERPRPIVLVCDISGSMERYSRFMLRFAHALQRSGAPLEIFVFATRLTRITRQLGTRSPNTALRQAAEKVVDWSGGTRIGESLRQPCSPARWRFSSVPATA